MKEVSCRLVGLIAEVAARDFSLPAAELLDGLPEPAAACTDPHGRIDWSTLCTILDRLAARVDPATFFHRARQHGPAARFFRKFAGFFTDSRRLYWFHATRLGPAMFSHLQHQCEAGPEGSIVITLSLPMTHQDSPAFWHLSASLYRTLPRELHQPDALLDAQITNRRAVFRITPPPPLTARARLRASFRGFFATRSTAELLRDQALEITRAHEALVQAREELERETALAARAEQARIAHDLHDSLGQHLTGVRFQCKLLEDLLAAAAPSHAAEAQALSQSVAEAATLARTLARGLAREPQAAE